MKNFDSLTLDPILMQSLADMGYNEPTPIQAKAIPVALSGRDIMGSAQTGTGKTAAFSIPMVQRLLTDPTSSALILTPTRELGKQIMDIVHQLVGKRSKIKTAFIIGGEPMHKQFKQLQNRPRLVIGTPGRINDHLRRGSLDLSGTNFLVLDETDRMLDMGFTEQLETIVEKLPQQRQTLMFSATLPKNIMNLSQRYLTNPERVSVGSTIEANKNIQQDIIRVKDHEKYQVLQDELDTRSGSVIIFVKTKHGTERLAKRLNEVGYTADAIHGDLKQSRRERVIRNYRSQSFRILVATDVVARGLDVPHIEHVINYDLPQVAEDYIHRIGRTGRASAKGFSLCLISPADGRKWHAIQCLMDPNSAKKDDSQFDMKRGKGGKGRRKSFGDKNKSRRNDNPYVSGKGQGRPDKAYQKSRSEAEPREERAGKPSHRRSEGQYQGDNRGRPQGGRPDHKRKRFEGKPEGCREDRRDNRRDDRRDDRAAGGRSEGRNDNRPNRHQDNQEGAPRRKNTKAGAGHKGKPFAGPKKGHSKNKEGGFGPAKRKTSGKPAGKKPANRNAKPKSARPKQHRAS